MLDIKENVELKSYSNIRLGGPARYFCEAQTVDELKDALKFAQDKKISFLILGEGSNTLFSDSGTSSLVIKTCWKGIEVKDNDTVVAAAGENWDQFVNHCINQGLQGVECLSGIPGSVGAVPIQNVGAYGQDVAQTIHRVHAIDTKTYETVRFDHKECLFAYRNSRFKEQDRNRYVITSVEFKLNQNAEPQLLYKELVSYVKENKRYKTIHDPVKKLKAVREAVLSIRKKKSMVVDPYDLNSRSLGSFFLNPELDEKSFKKVESLLNLEQKKAFVFFKTNGRYKISAAWLIDQAGFKKGYKYKSVQLSNNHNLAICNPRDGLAKDVLELSEIIKSTIHDKFSVELKREPVWIES